MQAEEGISQGQKAVEGFAVPLAGWCPAWWDGAGPETAYLEVLGRPAEEQSPALGAGSDQDPRLLCFPLTDAMKPAIYKVSEAPAHSTHHRKLSPAVSP